VMTSDNNGNTTILKDRVYYIALIDTLQLYDVSKVAERLMKVGIIKPLQSWFGGSGGGSSKNSSSSSSSTTTTTTNSNTTQSSYHSKVPAIQRPPKPHKLKSKGSVNVVGPVIGGYQIACPYCNSICFVDDSTVDQMFDTGIFGPVSCNNGVETCMGRVTTFATSMTNGSYSKGGFDFVPDEFLLIDRNISSIEPVKYRHRFIQFVKDRVCGNKHASSATSNNNTTPTTSPARNNIPLATSVLTVSSDGLNNMSIPVAPIVAPPPMAPTTQAYRVTVPHGVMPGSSFIVNANGQQFTITCPMNGGPGAIIEIDVPIRR
jgi:hypothetical protein